MPCSGCWCEGRRHDEQISLSTFQCMRDLIGQIFATVGVPTLSVKRVRPALRLGTFAFRVPVGVTTLFLRLPPESGHEFGHDGVSRQRMCNPRGFYNFNITCRHGVCTGCSNDQLGARFVTAAYGHVFLGNRQKINTLLYYSHCRRATVEMMHVTTV